MFVHTRDDDASVNDTDVLKELINVTAGAFLRSVDSKDQALPEMGVPSLTPFDAPGQWAEFSASPRACFFDAEGNPVALRVREAA